MKEEPMSDLISRQAAIAVADYTDYTGLAIEDVKKVTDEVVKGLKCLPSTQPKRKTGKWIKMSDTDGIYYCCSECGEELYRKWSFDRDYDLFPKKESIERTNFCSNCGADMRERDGE